MFFKHLESIVMNMREEPKECDRDMNFKLQVPKKVNASFPFKKACNHKRRKKIFETPLGHVA